jgi:hypothetical protein
MHTIATGYFNWLNSPSSGVMVFEQTVLMRHVMNNNLKRVIGTLMMDTIATGYFSRQHFKKAASVVNDLEASSLAEQGHAGHVHMHTHATHGHAHGAAMMIHATANEDEDSQLIRNRVVSNVILLPEKCNFTG